MTTAEGSGKYLFFDSGSHDADINWAANIIVFTSGSNIWSMKDNGTGLTQITNPADAGQWGSANLSIGDYNRNLGSTDQKSCLNASKI